jgi:hypothetical protein
MEWVAIDVNIADDPAVHRMADSLRVRVPELVGLLGLTFARMAQHAPDGNLAAVPDTLLEQWSRWHGKRGAFVAQFRAELCDDTGLVTAWEKYNGAHIRRAKAASARTKAWREKQERERTERELAAGQTSSQSANGNANVTHNTTHNVCGTGQDRTGLTTELPTDPPARAASIAETQLEAQSGAYWPDVARFLDERPSANRDEWAADLLRLIGPATGNLPEDLARACRDGKLAVPPVTNAHALRVFVATCRRERIAAAESSATTVRRANGHRPTKQEQGRAALAEAMQRRANEPPIGATNGER